MATRVKMDGRIGAQQEKGMGLNVRNNVAMAPSIVGQHSAVYTLQLICIGDILSCFTKFLFGPV